MSDERKVVNWIPVIELAVLAFTTLGTTITLYLHTETKIEDFRKETLSIHREILQEMKDFHGRLCSIEEKNKQYYVN